MRDEQDRDSKWRGSRGSGCESDDFGGDMTGLAHLATQDFGVLAQSDRGHEMVIGVPGFSHGRHSVLVATARSPSR